MKNKSLTLKELEETWWWRHAENRPELEHLKLSGYVSAARNYELMRRAPNAGNLDRNYLELNREDKTTAAIAWADPNEFPYRHVYGPQKQEAGWTDPHPQLRWNLRLSGRIMKKAFWDHIIQQRIAQNISPSHPLKGKKNRAPTWRYVEFLDMKRNKIADMDDSQRGMASKAEDLAIQYVEEFRQAQIKQAQLGKNWVMYDYFQENLEVPEM